MFHFLLYPKKELKLFQEIFKSNIGFPEDAFKCGFFYRVMQRYGHHVCTSLKQNVASSLPDNDKTQLAKTLDYLFPGD